MKNYEIMSRNTEFIRGIHDLQISDKQSHSDDL